MDKIIIKELKIFSYHGVNDFEKNKGQSFILDIIIYADLKKAGISDDLFDTVNYSKVVKAATAAFIAESYDLIETAAEKVCEKIFTVSRKINAVDLTLKKPHAPINADFNYIAVNIYRERKV